MKSMPGQEINLNIFYLSLLTLLFELNFNDFELFVFTTSKAVSYRGGSGVRAVWDCRRFIRYFSS